MVRSRGHHGRDHPTPAYDDGVSDDGPLDPFADDPAGFGGDTPANDPLQGVPVFGDLAKMLAQQGGMGWDSARQFAVMVATEGVSEPNVDPAERIRIEQLARIAELHVAQTTGLDVPTGRGGTIEPVTRTVWTVRTLDAHRRLFDLLLASLTPPAGDGPDATPDPDDPFGFMAPLLRMAAPMMLGLTAGSMVGHLARTSFGQYDLPLPRPAGHGIMVVPANIDAFGNDWSLAGDDLRLWVCLHELTWHTVLDVPHVRARYDELLHAWLSAFEPASGALEERLGGLDPMSLGDPSALPEALSDPEVLLGAIRSPAQHALLPELAGFLAVLVGYVDHVMDGAAARLLGASSQLTEALRRRRVEAGDGGRLVEKLFGLELSDASIERGRAFISGVVERSGEPALARLWDDAGTWPTPAEVDAPGLWLARIDLASS